MAFQRATHRFPRNLWLLKWGIPGIFTMFFWILWDFARMFKEFSNSKFQLEIEIPC
jgi:hypothetical protein